MKGLRKPLIIVGVVCAAIFSFAGIAYAATANEVVGGTTNQSIYKAADTVTITGTVNGDIYCAGQTITINATVNGDILCAGQTVDVDGTVNGSVHLVGQSVTLNATVNQNASLAGQDLVITRFARVGQDASFVGQSITINGQVSRDISAAGNSMMLNSSVGRNVTSYVNSLTLGGGTKVAGNVTYTGPSRLQRSGGAMVAGMTTYHEKHVHHAALSVGFLFLAKTYWLVAMTVLAIVLVALFPRQFKEWNPAWGHAFWWKLLIGFIGALVVPALIIVLMLTVLGIPLGLLLLVLWIAAALMTTPLAAYFTGNLIVPKLHPVLMVLIGSLVLGIIELIPFLGWIVGFAAYWLGSGILLTGFWQSYKVASGVRLHKSEGKKT